DEYSHHFIHYGAFSKNRSIAPEDIGFYRRIAITAHTGLRTDGRLRRSAVARKMAGLVGRVASGSLSGLFGKGIAGGGKYRFDEPAYDSELQAIMSVQNPARRASQIVRQTASVGEVMSTRLRCGLSSREDRVGHSRRCM